MLLVNGEPAEALPIADRGLQYGDGLFETIEIDNRRPIFFGRHLIRLEAGCLRLGIPFPGTALLTQETATLCNQTPSERAVLKIIVTSGSGGRGYKRPDAVHATRILSLHPYPDYPADFSRTGINARFCETRLGIQPALAGIKHLNRLEQVLARAEWSDTSIQEGIMQSTGGRVIEGTMGNLFFVRSGVLHTASLRENGVAGITRDLVIELASRHRIAFGELDYTQEQLLSADEIFVCNSIIGIWPVKAIERCSFPVGPVTRNMQCLLAEYRQETHAHE